MRLSIAVAALLGGLQAASALKLAPRSVAERELEVGGVCQFYLNTGWDLSHTLGKELEL
jgi:hypothetical protein